MGFMSQRYVPHCCLVYLTEKQKYLTKIIKCDEELILKDLRSIDVFKEKITKGEFLEKPEIEIPSDLQFDEFGNKKVEDI